MSWKTEPRYILDKELLALAVMLNVADPPVRQSKIWKIKQAEMIYVQSVLDKEIKRRGLHEKFDKATQRRQSNVCKSKESVEHDELR